MNGSCHILLTSLITFKEVSGLGALATDTANGSGGGSSVERWELSREEERSRGKTC